MISDESIINVSDINCPTCGDCFLEWQDKDLLECPRCGAQYKFEWVGKTDNPRLPPGVRQ